MDNKNKIKKKKINIINLVIDIILVLIMSFCLYKIGVWLYENYKSKQIANNYKNIQEKIDEININKISEKDKISIKDLKKQNPDTVAYLKVNNTNISYPIVKSNDNEYYLTHSFDKTYNSAGWPFMDYRNNMNDKDKNIVIYGHNRRDDSMFGSLDNVLKEDWQTNKKNKTILFITEKGIQKYEVFSVYEVLNEEYYITTNFTDKSYKEFINKISSRSIYDFNTKIDYSKNVLTLSTCSGNDKYRTVLHAIKKD